MPEDYGADDYGQETYSGDLEDFIEGDLIEYFPYILPRETKSVFFQYIASHDDEFKGFDEAMRYVEYSRFVSEAQGKDLDRIGEMFGALGARGDRSDDEYRVYLKSIVQSFNGRGTLPGLKFAIAAGVNADPDDVTVNEDFDNNEYELEISNADSAFLSGVINNLAELADPSAVELSAAPVIITEGDTVEFERSPATEIDSVSGLGSGEVTLTGDNTLE